MYTYKKFVIVLYLNNSIFRVLKGVLINPFLTSVNIVVIDDKIEF